MANSTWLLGNILLNTWRSIRTAGSAYQLIVGGWVDGFMGATGVDATASTNEVYNTANDYYSPLVTTTTAEILLVAGGGSGGEQIGGGGGAGGLIHEDAHEFVVDEYAVVVGAGGAAGGNNGADTTFARLTAKGGGEGARYLGSPDASSGGSGGGGRSDPTGYSGGAGTEGQGYAGGAGANRNGNYVLCGGGGGAGEVGGNAVYNSKAGDGGDGLAFDIVEAGTDVYYAGGGGGSIYTSGTRGVGGQGGGGDGSKHGATAGTAGTDGLGGGGGTDISGNSLAGGKGVVIIRYLTSALTATGGTITTDGDYTVHKFTSDGTFEVTELGESSVENMTLVSNAFTADTAPTTARIMILEEDVDAATINTDIKAYISRNNGTDYTQITLTDEGKYDGTKRILSGSVAISSTSGTSVRWKIETLNEKNLKIYGVGVTYK